MLKYSPNLAFTQCIEEKLEKQLQEAEVLETCAVLQCERLYSDIMKEARDKLGPDHPLTTKVTLTFISLSLSFVCFKKLSQPFSCFLGVSALKLPQLGPAFYRRGGGGGGVTWVNFYLACAAGLSEPVPLCSLSCEQK